MAVGTPPMALTFCKWASSPSESRLISASNSHAICANILMRVVYPHSQWHTFCIIAWIELVHICFIIPNTSIWIIYYSQKIKHFSTKFIKNWKWSNTALKNLDGIHCSQKVRDIWLWCQISWIHNNFKKLLDYVMKVVHLRR